MKIIEKAVYARLKADAAIATVAATRIHHNHLPQNSPLPALTYRLIDDVRPQTHDKAVGPSRARVQVTAHARDYPTARDLAEKVSDALLGFQGTQAGIVVQGVFFEGMVPLYDDDPVIKEHYIPTDFSVHYTP